MDKIETINELLDYVETEEKAYELIEYIKQLQQENKQLKEKMKNAIKFIEKFKDYYSYIPEDDIPELLAILKNE